MTFTKFVCWDVDRVRRVMGVEATQTPHSIFLATHHPIAMYRQELIDAPSRVTYSEEQFLKDFLAEQDFAFVPVLGSSGTGKSHLIRWLAANIESTQKRQVLLIPKIGTNLKDIISLILEGMPGASFDEYRQRLNRATSSLTQAQAREQLLNQLAAAVGPNGRGDRTKLSDVEDYLVGAVDSLLYDPFFRKHWLKDGGIIHQLVIHILGQRDTVEIVEERRHFSLGDLPLNVLNLGKAGKQAQEFYSFLIGDEDTQKATVDWLNRHLDEAIAQVLSLGREDLQRLMREVRETLAEQGIELVLLIEDFAKLQGIDREILEAVLARPQQPGSKPLCAIRTALACTTGYFDSLRLDTVKQRITFSVNLDLGTVGEQSLVNYADIKQFVGRYLNAVRLEEKTIQNWWADSRNRADSDRESLPSACNECEHKLACHAGFAEADGFGLYPFTPEALEQMLSRVNPGNFNPRILIKDVLKWTLENSAADIEGGEFPAISVREHFGKMRLSAMVQGDIQAKDPENGDRRQILLDLWTDSNDICDLHPEVHSAFDIPALGVEVQPTKKSSSVSGAKESRSSVSKYQVESQSQTKKNLTAAGQVPDKLTRQKEFLDRWNNTQESFPQDIAGELRPLIYSAIGERIEWDTEMLLKGVFASSGTTYFKSRNITFFSSKKTRETISGVKLSLPLNPDDAEEFRETAIAFQGMLQYSHYKHWRFPDGSRYFRTYAKQLERWSQYVVEQIRLYPRESGEPWNPVPAAVELLAIAATMAGHSTNSTEDSINALFLKLEPKDLENRSATWKKLFGTLQKHREALLDIVRSRTACTKGSSTQFQIIDTVQILEPLKQVSKSWQPQSEIPADVREKFSEIDKARQAVDEMLEKAIQEECDRQLAVYRSLVSELGEDINKKDVVDVVKQAMERARDAAVIRGMKNFDELTPVLKQFKAIGLSSYVDTMKRLQIEKDSPDLQPGKLLKYLSENHQKAMTESADFIKSTNNFLDASLKEVKNRIEELEVSGGGTVESSHRAIQDGLAKLRNLITEVKG